MKNSYLLATLLLMAGVQTALAQPGMVVRKSDGHLAIPISQVVSVEFVDNIKDYMVYEYVDLGLPSGTLWATCNVGALSPEEYGDYFAWGETETKSDYSWGTYKWMNAGSSSYDQVNKYTFDDNQQSGCWYINGYFVGDNMRRLHMEDDAATSAWGSEWQMPTKEQAEELTNNNYTTSEWIVQNGVKGCKITGKNGNSIFLPAAGFYQGTEYAADGDFAYYWTRSLSPSWSDYASMLIAYSGASTVSTLGRCMGCSIRPVRKSYETVDLGLPSGTLWAACNVGAESPEENGDYFAWGETEPKEDYSSSTYFDKDGEDGDYIKYKLDILEELQPEDDAATVNWGEDWQIPSNEQIRELENSDYTTWEWAQMNGADGIKIVSKLNGESLFLPAAGYRYGRAPSSGTNVNSWSRMLAPFSIFYKESSNAMTLWFYKEDAALAPEFRSYGLTVRPVRKK